LLAREVRSVDQLTGGRLELGLGTGHVRTEFEAAGLPWESPGRRVDRLAAMVHTLLDPELYSVRREAPCRIPDEVGRNSEERSWV
jgi:alkanesulfonate monooxygenase SsuD/methylene tetrahydromethanopterin reductase-like flavin-dependent oxidoreductase (luciferase family)